MGGASPWVAALDANDNPIVSDTGKILDPINNFAWTGPWGQAFVSGPQSPAAFYESNVNNGSIVRINLGSTFTFDTIATGFPVNHGVPGSILAPSGLTYDPQRDLLYIVDGATNALISISNPATIPNGGIVVKDGYVGGAYASRVSVVYHGAPLRKPISAALLYNGDIVVGNTANNNLVEITPSGSVVGQKVLDTGAAGALFGIVATGTSTATTKVYFNDDNDRSLLGFARGADRKRRTRWIPRQFSTRRINPMEVKSRSNGARKAPYVARSGFVIGTVQSPNPSDILT
jgi:hypothetical protein